MGKLYYSLVVLYINMRLTQFPDIKWLRPTAEDGFSNQRDVNDRRLPHKGWPNVILHTQTGATERNGIKGPFSLFFNLKGSSLVRADHHSIAIGPDTFGITNPGQYYDLIIPERETATTFNIHFSHHLYSGVAVSCGTSHETHLDHGENINTTEPHVMIRTYFQSVIVRNHIRAIYQAHHRPGGCSDVEEELLLSELMIHLQKLTQKNLAGLNSITSLKKATRKELLKRLLLSIEYIHDNYSAPLTIDRLSAVSCLSKFHYLRTFKEAFGCTPSRYWQWVRWQKAMALLENSTLSINEISAEAGFTEVNAFIKFFSRKQGVSPGGFRKAIISNPG